jgi:hypothetical protein
MNNNQKKILNLLLSVILILTGYIQSGFSQSRNEIPDTVFRKNVIPCGATSDYFKTLAVTPAGSTRNAATNPADTFDPAAIEHCGKFDIYYEDLLPASPLAGYSEPAGVGLARRNTLCAVLTYVQSIYDFSNIPAGAPIRLIVNQSFAPVVNPAPVTATYLAFAGPFFINTGTPGIINGFVHDYTVTGVDPAAISGYHAELTTNFDQAFDGLGNLIPLNWHNDVSIPTVNCRYDLYSVLLHEVGHTLGWLSYTRRNTGTNFPESILGSNQYSGIDYTIYKGTVAPLALNKLIQGPVNGPFINPAYTTDPFALVSNDLWISPNAAPDNHPIYSGLYVTAWPTAFAEGSILSHMDDQMLLYSTRSRISPGDVQDYVMGPFGVKGILRRTFTDVEINTIWGLGYSLNPLFTGVPNLINLPPYSTKMAGYNNIFDNDFPEQIAADFPPLVNNVGSNLVINIGADPTSIDLEGNPITIATGSLVNIRGCGNGGNNHNQLSVAADNSTITFTPRPDFYGRAQFGLKLFDGNEVGSYVIYTIDVLKGTNVNCAPGSNLILNGDLEEGTETKTIGADEGIDASLREQEYLREGKVRQGIHFADCQPYCFLSNNWGPFGSGELVKDSWIECSGTTSYRSAAGSWNTSFPIPWGSIPGSAGGIGDRYKSLQGEYNYFNLCSDMVHCNRYFLEFDYYAKTSVPNGTNIPLTVSFTNNSSYPVVGVSEFNFVNNIVVTNGAWQHVIIPFTYCGTNPASILNLQQTAVFFGFMIDNLQLYENLTPAPPLVVAISPASPTICAGSNVTLTANVTNSLCADTYVWTPGGAITSSISVSPAATTNYTVTVNDGCRIAADNTTVTVVPLPVITFNPIAPVCSGSTPFTLTATPTGGTYTGTGVSGSTFTPPVVTSSTTYTITYNYTDANGCSSNAAQNITVNPSPAATFGYTGSPYCSTATATNPFPTFSGGGIAGTFSSTAGLVFVSTSTGQVNLSASTPGTYTVTNTVPASGGCPAVTSTATITINAPSIATFSYAGTPYCTTAANPFPTFIGGGTAGTFSSTAGLVFVSASTGEVNLSASTPGTYTVTNTVPASGGCPAAASTATITINASPVAAFSYTGTPYCTTASNPSPAFSGGGIAGTFSSTAGLVFVSTSTGQVNLSASTPGTYTVTNTIAASGGCPAVSATATITITAPSVATFSYTASPYCATASNPLPTFTGGGIAGTFSSTTGLAFVSTSTGQINLPASTPGTYTVTNTIAASGGCPAVSSTASITITPAPVATFSYTGSPYCSTAINPSPTFSGGGIAGAFSSSTGLVFVSTSTGEVNLSASIAGTYTVTNTIAASGGCPAVTATATITITAPSVATFSYTGSPYCTTAANPFPTFTGGGVAGTFSSTAGLVFVSTSTGQVNLSASTPGTYTVTNTIAASGGCPAVTATSTIVINNCVSVCTSCTVLPSTLTSSPVGHQVYCINSPLTISGAISLTWCEIKIASTVAITVDPGATLTISGSHLYSCSDMWQGIIVKPGGKVVVQNFTIGPWFSRSSLIEDARVAIDILPGSTLTTGILTVNNATFNRNEFSIKISGYAPVLATYPFSIVNSIFTCRDIPFVINSINWPTTTAVKTAPIPLNPLQTPYINTSTYSETNAAAYLKPPFTTSLPGVKSNTAIHLNNVGFVINPATSPTWYEIKIGANGTNNFNIFDNQTFCVNASNSNFTCVNNVFQHTIGGNNGGGIAVNAIAKELNFRAQVIAGTPTGLFNNRFFDCSTAINTVNYFENTFRYCDVRSNQFTVLTAPAATPANQRGKFGFFVRTNRFRVVNMSDNKLYNIENGITFFANFGPYNIGGVYFSSLGQYSGQVDVNRNEIAPNLPSFSLFSRFTRNAISLSNVIASGIQVIPSTTVNVNNNIIKNVHRGIFITSWSRKNIINNSNTLTLMTDPYSASATQFGISQSSNSGATFQGNSINANTVTGTGIFSNPSIYGIITTKCNDERVVCNNVNGTTHGIEFSGFHFNTKFDNNSMTNNFYGYVLSNNGIIGTQGDPSHPADNSWTGTWTSPRFKTATLSGSSAQNSKMYIRTSSPSNFNPDPSGFTLGGAGIDEYLFSTTPPTLIVSPTPVAYTGCAVIVVGGGSGGTPGAASVALLEKIAQDNIPFLNNPDETKYINKNQLYRLLKADASLRSSSAVLQSFYNSSIATTREAFSSIEDDIAMGDLTNSQAKTDAIVPANSIEDNYKTFFDTYLKYQTDTILPGDSIALLKIANGCPYTDGDVVHQARALYNSINRTNIYFEDNCAEVPQRSFTDVKTNTESSFDVLVYPNPNTGVFSLVPFSSDVTELDIKAMDVNGKTVFDKTINSGERMFNLSLDAPNGIYMLFINNPDTNERIVKRIVIQK